MSWVEHAIWWHIYPLGLCGAPIREPDTAPGPRLRRLFDWIDYAIELGCSGLLLGPIFESQSHGYDSLDLFRIDPASGMKPISPNSSPAAGPGDSASSWTGCSVTWARNTPV